MKKLKLEALEITSFVTSPAVPRARGTVQGHGPGGQVDPKTYDIVECGDTNYMDCTYGCSINTACPNGCIEP